MTKRHFYFGIENVGLNAEQRGLLVTELEALGAGAGHREPAQICHWRIRLDGEATIFEALFNEDNLTVETFKNRLANIFGVAPGSITHDLQTTEYGPVVTFSRSGEKLRMLLFGGVGATWQESGAAACAYIAANRDEWEPAGE